MIYLSALLGSLLFVFIRIKIEKQKHDDGIIRKINWKKYFEKEWDDFAFSVIAGQCLAHMQDSLFFGYATWQEWDQDKAINFYYDSEEAIAGGMGLFGSVLILLLFKYVVRKASKMSDNE